MEYENPYNCPRGNWERGRVGKDIYQIPMYCPYCGSMERHEITIYEGAWFRLKCRECGELFKVRCRAK